MGERPTLLVDASSLIYRAYYSTPTTVVSTDGKVMNAAHGFLHMLARLVSDRDPEALVCATDEDWRPQWRVDLIDTYKTHRTEDERAVAAQTAEDDLAVQMPPLFELLAEIGVPVAGCPGFEAEDVIGALVPRAKGRVEIVSGDRDLFQLVRDPDVKILYPKRGVSELAHVDESYITNKYGIPGRTYGDFALLRGDPSDGLPGVVGIGEKTASALIAKYGSISKVIEAAILGEPSSALAKVRGSLDYLDRAARVVLISDDVDIGEVEMVLPTGPFDRSTFERAASLGLEGALRRLTEALGKTAAR